MCLIAFAYQQHPRYPLIVIANRDEFYERPTEQAHWWENEPGLLAGKDVLAGGSWMGVGRNGRFAALTNYREPQNIKQHAPTRGLLVTDYILGNAPTEQYLNDIQENGQAYNGFNLLTGGPEELWWYSNRGKQPQKLEPGIYGVSNALLDSPWPKLVHLKEKLAKLLESDTFSHEKALDALVDKTIAPDPELPKTGVPLEWERRLSAMYIEMEKYGTRCSTVLTFEKKGQVRFTEHSYVPDRGRFEDSFSITHTAAPSLDSI
jgi:uncharacterized protein with NRDE domain